MSLTEEGIIGPVYIKYTNLFKPVYLIDVVYIPGEDYVLKATSTGYVQNRKLFRRVSLPLIQ